MTSCINSSPSLLTHRWALCLWIMWYEGTDKSRRCCGRLICAEGNVTVLEQSLDAKYAAALWTHQCWISVPCCLLHICFHGWVYTTHAWKRHQRWKKKKFTQNRNLASRCKTIKTKRNENKASCLFASMHHSKVAVYFHTLFRSK